MIFICFDGTQVKINVKSSDYPRRVDVSNAQRMVGDTLEEIFPRQIILEEFVIPRSAGLRIDFFLPHMGTAVEVDGAQHDKFTPFFHGTKYGFERAKMNDKRKSLWCETNGIRIIRVRDTVTKEEIEEIFR